MVYLVVYLVCLSAGYNLRLPGVESHSGNLGVSAVVTSSYCSIVLFFGCDQSTHVNLKFVQ